MARESFVFYKSFLDAIRLLPEEKDRVAALMAIIEYGCGEEPDVNGAAAAILAIAMPNIDSAVKKRTDGAKGGRPRKETSGLENKKPVVSESENHRFEDCKSNENVNVNENVNEEDNAHTRDDSLNDHGLLPNDPANAFYDPVDVASVIGDPEMAKALTNWIKVRQTIGPYPYGAITECLDAAKRARVKYGEAKCIEAIKRATAGAWKNIRWEELETARSGTTRKNAWTQMDNNQYDMDELEHRLLEAQG